MHDNLSDECFILEHILYILFGNTLYIFYSGTHITYFILEHVLHILFWNTYYIFYSETHEV